VTRLTARGVLTVAIVVLTIVGVAVGFSLETASKDVGHSASVTIVNGAWDSSNSQHFFPATITVVIGVNNTVIWTNNDTVYHTVTSNTGVFNSGLLNSGNSWNYTFTAAGTYNYHCTLHLFMDGSVIVIS
jgi:plastocyanin